MPDAPEDSAETTTTPLDGDDIRAWLAQHGLSQARLAEQLGVSRATVEFWCQGRTRPPPYLWRALRDLAQHEFAPPAPQP